MQFAGAIIQNIHNDDIQNTFDLNKYIDDEIDKKKEVIYILVEEVQLGYIVELNY